MDLNNIAILEQIVLENATRPLRRTNKHDYESKWKR